MCTNADQLPNKLTELQYRADKYQADIIAVTEVIPKNQNKDE